jgi:hypothetical protein
MIISRRAFLAGLGLVAATPAVKAGGLLNSFFVQAMPSISYQENEIDTTNASEYTFTGKAFGAAAARSLVIVGLSSQGTITAVTIGGVTATLAVSGGDSQHVHIYYAVVPTVSSGDVVVTFSASTGRCAIHIFAAYNLTSTTPTDTANDTADGSDVSSTIDVSERGVLVAVAVKENNTTCTWTGVTERYDQQGEGTHTAGDYTATAAETGRTILADFAVAGDETGLAAAAWR